MWYYGVFYIIFCSVAIGFNIGALLLGSGHWTNWIWIGIHSGLLVWGMKKLRALSYSLEPAQQEPPKQIAPSYNFTSPDYNPPSAVTGQTSYTSGTR